MVKASDSNCVNCTMPQDTDYIFGRNILLNSLIIIVDRLKLLLVLKLLHCILFKFTDTYTLTFKIKVYKLLEAKCEPDVLNLRLHTL